MKSKETVLATAAALGSVLLFSTGGLFIKLIPLNALTISGFRSLLAALFFAAVLSRRGGFRAGLRLSPTGWAAAFAYALVVTLFVAANKLTTAANVIFLQYTMPAWVLIGGALWLGERVTPGRLASVVFCLAGMALFFQGGLKQDDWLGNSFALLSGFFFAVMTLCLRMERDGNQRGAVFMGNVITAVSNLALTAILWPSDFGRLNDLRMWGGLLWLGIFQVGLAYVFFTAALKHLPAIEVAILSLLEPILNPMWVFLSIGETPSGWAMAGGGIILSSVLIRAVVAEEAPETPEMAAVPGKAPPD